MRLALDTAFPGFMVACMAVRLTLADGKTEWLAVAGGQDEDRSIRDVIDRVGYPLASGWVWTASHKYVNLDHVVSIEHVSDDDPVIA